MTGKNVIYLAFKSREAVTEFATVMSCKICKNKTYTVVYEDEDFPMMKCASCGNRIGKIGWAD